MPIGQFREEWRIRRGIAQLSSWILSKPSPGPELLKNGDFSAWTADNPDNWTVVGESGSDPMITEVGAGGGAGTGLARIFNTAVLVYIRQSVLIIGQWYQAQLDIDTIVSGNIKLSNAAGQDYSPVYSTVGTKVTIFQAVTNTQFVVQRNANPTDVTVDNVSVRPL